ncbi:hypothetical protein FRC08_002187 [Ceratobasidium sp. 394]|nr:hypothetical protein FRC08_002187 [Ceratobasidium sp. 394]
MRNPTNHGKGSGHFSVKKYAMHVYAGRVANIDAQLGSGTELGANSRSRSLSEKVSSMSLQTRISDPEYVSPLEAIEPVQEETLQVHYMDPNQHAAKEGLLKLLDGSSQFPEAEVINLDTQTEPELSQGPPPAPVPAKRKRGGATSSASRGKRKSQRKA